MAISNLNSVITILCHVSESYCVTCWLYVAPRLSFLMRHVSHLRCATCCHRRVPRVALSFAHTLTRGSLYDEHVSLGQRHVSTWSTPCQHQVNATSAPSQSHISATSAPRQRHVGCHVGCHVDFDIFTYT